MKQDYGVWGLLLYDGNMKGCAEMHIMLHDVKKVGRKRFLSQSQMVGDKRKSIFTLCIAGQWNSLEQDLVASNSSLTQSKSTEVNEHD